MKGFQKGLARVLELAHLPQMVPLQAQEMGLAQVVAAAQESQR